jgi:hypothetical protein
MTNTATPHRPRKIGAKQWAIECTWGCGHVITTPRKPPVMLGCDRSECAAAHNASAQDRHAANTSRRTVTTIRNGI